MIDLKGINEKYLSAEDFLAADKEYIAKLSAIKDEIEKNVDSRPVTLLSGPSGSGKTTTAKMLEKMLDDEGYETHVISLDDYFKTMKAGEVVDFESPERVDGELLSSHIERLTRSEEILVPSFDFVGTRRTDNYTRLKRGEKEIVIFEGIHALNPSVVNCDKISVNKIFVSVQTSVGFNDKVFPPELIRLLRRIARDRLYRGRSAADTIAHFKSVTDGEAKYVYPFAKNADFTVNSFIPYEPKVFKTALGEEIEKISGENQIAADLNDFLSNVKGTDLNFVPARSLIREFI